MVKTQSNTITGTFRASYLLSDEDGIFGKVFLAEVTWKGRSIRGNWNQPGETILDDVTITGLIWMRDSFHIGASAGVQMEPLNAAHEAAYVNFLNALMLRKKNWSSRLHDRAEAELVRAVESGSDDIADTDRIEMDEFIPDLVAA